jgi:hypothetical protein
MDVRVTGNADRDGLASQPDHDFLPASDLTPASPLQVGESLDVVDLDRNPGRTTDLTLLGGKPSAKPFSGLNCPIARTIGFGYKRFRHGSHACLSTLGHRAD